MSDNNSDSGIETSRFATFFDKNGWWYAAAALMLLVGLGLIVIILLPSPDSGNGTTPTTAPTDTAPPPLSSPANPSGSASTGTGWSDLGCNGTKGSTEPPLLAPKATWEPVGVMSAPTSSTYGPTKVEGFVRNCYQHTPTGAVFAGLNYTIAIGTAPEGERKAVIEAAMTPGTERDKALETQPGGLGWKITAFHIAACTAERCNVVYIVSANGALGQLNVAMVWEDGDWRFDGTRNPGGGSIDSVPAGYINWEA